MPVVIILAAAVILGGVVVVAMGRGGELARNRIDLSSRTDFQTWSDVAGYRPPAALLGYHAGATEHALSLIARTLAERDAEIDWLRRRLSEAQSAAAADETYPDDDSRSKEWHLDDDLRSDESHLDDHLRSAVRNWLAAEAGAAPDTGPASGVAMGDMAADSTAADGSATDGGAGMTRAEREAPDTDQDFTAGYSTQRTPGWRSSEDE